MLEKIIHRASSWDVLIVIASALAIVGFWRGVWNLMDKFLFPENFILSQFASIIFGIILLWALSGFHKKDRTGAVWKVPEFRKKG